MGGRHLKGRVDFSVTGAWWLGRAAGHTEKGYGGQVRDTCDIRYGGVEGAGGGV